MMGKKQAGKNNQLAVDIKLTSRWSRYLHDGSSPWLLLGGVRAVGAPRAAVMAAIAVAELCVDGIDVMSPVVSPFSTANAVSDRIWKCGGQGEDAEQRQMDKNCWIECQVEIEEREKKSMVVAVKVGRPSVLSRTTKSHQASWSRVVAIP